MDHAEEAFGELIIPGCAGPVDLEMTEHAFDAVPLLVECSVMLDFYATVLPARNNGLDLPFSKVGTDGISIVALVSK